jgi:hypothetical protein
MVGATARHFFGLDANSGGRGPLARVVYGSSSTAPSAALTLCMIIVATCGMISRASFA